MNDADASVVNDIMQKYPEDEWLDHCHVALPHVDDIDLLITFEMFSGGDVRVVDEHHR